MSKERHRLLLVPHVPTSVRHSIYPTHLVTDPPGDLLQCGQHRRVLQRRQQLEEAALGEIEVQPYQGGEGAGRWCRHTANMFR